MSQSGWTVLDVEALIREVFEILKTKVDAEERFDALSNSRGPEEGEEVVFMSTKVGVDTEAEAGYDDTTREGCGASHPLVMWRKEG